jgi:hypothetical protein
MIHGGPVENIYKTFSQASILKRMLDAEPNPTVRQVKPGTLEITFSSGLKLTTEITGHE